MIFISKEQEIGQEWWDEGTSHCAYVQVSPFLNLRYVGLELIEEHRLEADPWEAVSSKDSQLSLKGQELEEIFGEGIEVGRELTGQPVGSGKSTWEWRSERRVGGRHSTYWVLQRLLCQELKPI